MNGYSTLAASRRCLICNAPLSFHQARTSPLCGQEECDWRYSILRRRNQVCKVCGRPLALEELAGRVCAVRECQRAALGDFPRRVQERNQARSEALIRQEIEQATRLRDRVLNVFGLKEPAFFPLVVIPAFVAKLVNLPRHRRRKFRDHLTSLISQAAVPLEPSPDQNRADATNSTPGLSPKIQAVMGMACSCCKGLCCGGGTDHAYLKVETIRRYQAGHPNQRPRDVLAAYLDRVGNRTYEGSCIFHQGSGCALPRDMRADICNRHYCKALQTFQRNLSTTGPIRAFFVSAHHGTIQTAALVHENQMLAVQEASSPPPEPTGE